MTQTQSLLAGTLAALLMAIITSCTNMPAAPTLTAAAKAELASTGALRVAVFTGNPVIGAKDKATGLLTGTTVELGRALSNHAGVPVTFVEYTVVAKMVEDAKTNAWDIAVVAFDPARLGVLDFAPPHISVDLPRFTIDAGCRYANLNFSEPSFSIVLTISSPAFNHTCFSLGYPRMTPWGVPDQMMSPGSSVHILVM